MNKNIALSRNKYYDILKGLLIIFVVVAHGFQFGNGPVYAESSDFFDYKIVKFIYSFHMPLFAIICGVFFYYSLQRYSFIHNIEDKFRQFVIPMFLISLFYFAFTKDLCMAIESSAGGLWFLLAMFYSVVVTMIMDKLCCTIIHEISFMVIITVLLYFVNNAFCLSIHKFMILFFVAGYIANKYDFVNSVINYNKKKILYFVGGYVAYVSLPYFFSLYGGFGYGNQNIIWGFCSLILRFSISLFFALVFMNIINWSYNKTKNSYFWNIISKIGRYTMGIYVFQTIIFGYIKSIYLFPINNILLKSLCVGTFVFVLSYFLTYLSSKINVLRYFLIGLKWK